MSKPGPRRGSDGAHSISEAHRGHHEHDDMGWFAANPELAREMGRRGGEAIKRKYGLSFYRQIGKMGGETVKQKRGSEYYSKIGVIGAKKRWG